MIDTLTQALGSNHTLASMLIRCARGLSHQRGAQPRPVLAKLAPVDLSRAAFTTGMIRRTPAAQVPAAFMDRRGRQLPSCPAPRRSRSTCNEYC